jgi:hypothetical protein
LIITCIIAKLSFLPEAQKASSQKETPCLGRELFYIYSVGLFGVGWYAKK